MLASSPVRQDLQSLVPLGVFSSNLDCLGAMVGFCAVALSDRLRVDTGLGRWIVVVAIVMFELVVGDRVGRAMRDWGSGCTRLADLQSLPTSDFIHKTRGKIGVLGVDA